ncbi:MAG: protein kinase [Acidobacteriota bacterium]
MDANRWAQVDRLFHLALERPSSERVAFLRHACFGDVALEDEVRSLLTREDDAASFLEQPAMDAATGVRALDLGPGTDTLGPTPGADARLLAGQEFGPYRIVRLLGRGGMGEVYEAEHLDQGRRVALKVLNQRLTDPHDRARFLREGQLAASINHPNSVYIFGSDEIAGTPVIAMELLPGGTLRDRVCEQGPLEPALAVAAILQVIAGLEAAYAGGILHRDVKPANCFIDGNGVVKIGDFGLSIPTQAPVATVLTQMGSFHGTPQFSPPERLKGVPQDVRADIYAVGATLYYLLAGQLPFDGTDLMALVTQIATEVPRSPREVVPAVPRKLAAIVLCCLAKDREARPASYAALTEALRPFGSAAPTPATIAWRFMAGAIDHAILSFPFTPFNMAWIFRSAAPPWWLGIVGVSMSVVYYGLLEGLWGGSLGKRMVGLRVTKADGQPAGLAPALRRAVIFQTPSVIGVLPALFLGPGRFMESLGAWQRVDPTAATLMVWVPLALLFCTARARNGFAGVHDLASGTRVVRRLERSARSVLPVGDSPPVAGPGGRRFGPYEVVGTLGRTDVGEVLLGFDPGLRRHVWIHSLPPGSAAVGPLIRDVSRAGRLRWLNGRRSNGDAWDAYEALDGVPLASVHGAGPRWRLVGPWLLDLAREIDAGLKDGSAATLTIEHVWITRDGYAKLLDFCPPGVRPAAYQAQPATLESGQTFLSSVARHALGGSPADESGATVRRSVGRLWRWAHGSSGLASGTAAVQAREPLPLSASATLETLARHGFATASDVVARMTALLQRPDRVGRWRRAATVVLCSALPVMSAFSALVFLPVMSRALTPNAMALNNALTHLSSLSRNSSGERAQERAALEVYIAVRFRPMIIDPQTWTTPPLITGVLGRWRGLAERVVAEHPNASRDELALAEAALGPFLRDQEQQRRVNFSRYQWRPAAFALGGNLTFIALCGVVWAFILRGGLLLRACGVAVVTRDGKPASRPRALSRALIAWSLVPTAFGVAIRGGVSPGRVDTLGLEVATALFVVGVIWAVLHPRRGLQDWLAGTWLVPQ